MIIYRIGHNNLSTMATINKTSIDVEDKSFTSFHEYFNWIFRKFPSTTGIKEFIIENNYIKLHASSIPNITTRNIVEIYDVIDSEFQKVVDINKTENKRIAEQSNDALFIKSIEDYRFSDDLSIETKKEYVVRAIMALVKSLD